MTRATKVTACTCGVPRRRVTTGSRSRVETYTVRAMSTRSIASPPTMTAPRHLPSTAKGAIVLTRASVADGTHRSRPATEHTCPGGSSRPLSYEPNCSETAFVAPNVVPTMQAIACGGLCFAGLNRWSILGAFADDGSQGFGFRLQRDERWTLPNAVGLDGHFEGSCPPYHANMHAAGAVIVGRYEDAFVECLATVAQVVFDTHATFPGAYLETHAEHLRR